MSLYLFSGKKYVPYETKDFDIADIVSGLSFSFRFGGQRRPLMTIAQHCCIVYDIAIRLGADANTAMFALMHDASESYIGDMVSPVKRELPDYLDLEENLLDSIMKWIGVDITNEDIIDFGVVKEIDKISLWYEENTYWLLSKDDMNNTHRFGYYDKKPFSYLPKIEIDGDISLETKGFYTLFDMYRGFRFWNSNESEYQFYKRFSRALLDLIHLRKEE